MNVSSSTSNAVTLYTAADGSKLYGFTREGGEEFMKRLMSTPEKPEMLLYNGSRECAVMTNDQVAELAEKYDPTNMTQDEYRNLLDDLAGFGVISQIEKELMGYNKGIVRIGYVDEEGDWIPTRSGNLLSSDSPLYEEAMNLHGNHDVHLGEDGNLKKTLEVIGEWKIGAVTAPGNPAGTRALAKSAEQAKKRRQVMNNVVNLIMDRRKKLGLKSGKDAEETEEKTEGTGLMEQAAAPGGDFWINLRNFIIENAREKRKQAEEDEAIELLTMLVDRAVGRENPKLPLELRVSAMTRELL